MTALLLLAGPPGAGKTTWRKTRFPDHQAVCLDEIRFQVTGSESDHTAEQAVVQMRDLILFERMKRHLFTVLDATNARHEQRVTPIAYASAYGMPKVAVVFNMSVEECMARQAGRVRQVDRDIVTAIHRDLAGSLAALRRSTQIQVYVTPDGHTVEVSQPQYRGVLGLLTAVEGWFAPVPAPAARGPATLHIMDRDDGGEWRITGQTLELARGRMPLEASWMVGIAHGRGLPVHVWGHDRADITGLTHKLTVTFQAPLKPRLPHIVEFQLRRPDGSLAATWDGVQARAWVEAQPAPFDL